MAVTSLGRRQLRLNGVIWLICLAPFFFLTYGQVNYYTATLTEVDSIVFTWEQHIPFWPWTIVPYWSIDLLYGLSLFICTSRRELWIHGWRLVTASLIACTGFLLYPLRFSFVRPESEGMFGWLFTQLEQFDLPFNQAPSLHIILLWLLWLRFYAHIPQTYRWLLHSWFILIGLSVLTTWQHHFIDVITGLAVGILISYGLPIQQYWHWQPSTDSKANILAVRYAGVATIFVGIAWGIGGFGWILLWPAMSLFLVSLAYFGLGSSVFQKANDGGMTLSARLLLAPYRLGSWLSFLYYCRQAPVYQSITQQLYIGCFPQRLPLQINAVLDMTADWPRAKASISCHYYTYGWPDLIAPSNQQLQQSVSTLSAVLAAERTVLVHCALGLSRSAIVIAAWLLAEKRVSSPEQAIAELKAIRPQVVLNAAYIQRLTEWYQYHQQESLCCSNR